MDSSNTDVPRAGAIAQLSEKSPESANGIPAALLHLSARPDFSAPSDDLGRKIVDLITRPGEARDRLSQQAYTTLGPGNPLGLLQEALELSEQMAPLERKLKQSQKEGLIRSEYLGHQIDEAERAEIISKTEAKNLRSYHQKVLDLLAVDDFAADEIGRAGARSKAAPQKPVAKKAAARKKVAKKKISSKKKIAKKPSG